MSTKDPSYRALLDLGDFLRESLSFLEDTPRSGLRAPGTLEELLGRVYEQNAWFTRESCLHALKYWGEKLRTSSLDAWLGSYPAPEGSPATVALILAGNIPLVGFHDLICVLLTGNRALVKCASNDGLLLPFLARRLEEFAPELVGRVAFTDGKLQGYDAVIATGSNNTSRYFEYYFSSRPHIIRRNRHGVAVLNGKETPRQLEGLAEDVFRYYGMGCRSVSKIFVPQQYDFDPLFGAFYRFSTVTDHPKYANNYDYNKAVYLMSGSAMLDNGFLLLKADESLGSPIGTLFYETYGSEAALHERLRETGDQIQCLVAGQWLPGSVPFGQSQWPDLSEYADGVDTVDFLLKTSASLP